MLGKHSPKRSSAYHVGRTICLLLTWIVIREEQTGFTSICEGDAPGCSVSRWHVVGRYARVMGFICGFRCLLCR